MRCAVIKRSLVDWTNLTFTVGVYETPPRSLCPSSSIRARTGARGRPRLLPPARSRGTLTKSYAFCFKAHIHSVTLREAKTEQHDGRFQTSTLNVRLPDQSLPNIGGQCTYYTRPLRIITLHHARRLYNGLYCLVAQVAKFIDCRKCIQRTPSSPSSSYYGIKVHDRLVLTGLALSMLDVAHLARVADTFVPILFTRPR